MKRSRRRFLKTAVGNLAVPIMAGLALPGHAKAKSPSARTVSDHAPGFPLTENGTGRVAIVLPDSASEVMRFASEELQRYIRAISSGALPIRTFQRGSPEKQVLLGSPSEARRVLPVGEDVDWPAEGTDQFTIKVTKDRIVLCGGSERSTLYAVYQLLEDLGCRWLAPGQDYLPRRESLEAPLGSKKVGPAMKWRVLNLDQLPPTAEFIDYFAKQKFNVLFLHRIPELENVPTALWEEVRRRGISIMGGGHLPVHFLPIEEYGPEHPEWFSLIKGHRVKPDAQSWHICHSNKEALRTFIQNCLDFLKAYPVVDTLIVWENDAFGAWCECDACRALEPEPDRIDPAYNVPDRSVTYMRFVKQVAEAIHEQMPNRRVCFGPYYNLMTFPADPNVLPPRDTLLMLDDWKQCYRHALSHPCNLPTQDKLSREWMPLYPESLVWTYYHTRVCGIPAGLGTRIAKDMRYIPHRRINGFLDCITPLEAPYLPEMFGQESLNFYVLAKLSWDPSLDLEQVTRDFTEHGYGSAAEAMRKFHDLLDTTTYGFGEGALVPEDKAYLKEIHTGFFMSPRAYIPNRERLEELKSLVAQALEESTDDAVRQRIQPLLSGMQVAEALWDAEVLPPNERMAQIPKIQQLAGPYLRPGRGGRLQIVITQWEREAAKAKK